MMNSLLAAGRPAWESLRAQWLANGRLRLGSLLILLILAFYTYLLAADWRDVQAKNLQSSQAQSQRLGRLARQNEWPARAQQAAKAREQVAGMLWQASSPGLAEANLLAWLNEQLAAAGVHGTQLQVAKAEALADVGQVYRVRADIQGTFAPNALQRFLLFLAQNPQPTQVERLDIQNGDNKTFALSISAWFRVPAAKAGG